MSADFPAHYTHKQIGPAITHTQSPTGVEFQSTPRIHFSLFNLPSTAFRGRNDAAGDVIPYQHTPAAAARSPVHTHTHTPPQKRSPSQTKRKKYVAPDAAVTFRHVTACHVTRTFSLLQIQILQVRASSLPHIRERACMPGLATTPACNWRLFLNGFFTRHP